MQLAKVLPVPLSPKAAHHYHPGRVKSASSEEYLFGKLEMFSYIAGILPSNHEVQSRHNLGKMTKMSILSEILISHLPICWIPIFHRIFEFVESHRRSGAGVGEEVRSWFLYLEARTELKKKMKVKAHLDFGVKGKYKW